jgi:hypothetical protein
MFMFADDFSSSSAAAPTWGLRYLRSLPRLSAYVRRLPRLLLVLADARVVARLGPLLALRLR